MDNVRELRASVEGELAVKPVKTIVEKYAILRSKLASTTKELAEKKGELKQMEREVYLAEGSLTIVQEKLRGIKENCFHAKNSLEDKETFHEELVKELVEVQWRAKLAQDQYNDLESAYVDFQVDKAVRIDQINDMEASLSDEEKRRELEELSSVVQKYKEYKERLASGDPELLRILSGEALVELEDRKSGIKDAFARREARVEGIYMEIDEKKEAVADLQQAILIKEKGNQAKIRRLQRELQDKEATENHLKQTVEYLDRQIDPAVSKGNASIATTHPVLYDSTSSISSSSSNKSAMGKSTYGGRK